MAGESVSVGCVTDLVAVLGTTEDHGLPQRRLGGGVKESCYTGVNAEEDGRHSDTII